MHPATGGSAMGVAAGDLPSQMGPSPRASRRGPPTPLTTTRGAEQGAVVAAPSRRSRSRAARGQRGARGWVRAQWSLAVARSTRRRTRPLGLQIRQVRGAPGNLCASQGPGRRGAAASRAWAPVPVPQDQPRRTRPQVRPPAPPAVPAPGWGGVGEGGWARPIFVLPFFPPRRPARQCLPSPRPGRGRRERPVRGARRRRPCVQHAASGARPLLSSFPGSSAGAVCGAARRGLTKSCGGGLADRAGSGGGGRAAPRPGQVSGSLAAASGRGPARGQGRGERMLRPECRPPDAAGRAGAFGGWGCGPAPPWTRGAEPTARAS